MADRGLYRKLERYLLTEQQLQINDYPRPDPSNPEKIKLYGDHFNYQKDHCKRCKEKFDTTYRTSAVCKFHYGRSWKHSGNWKRWTCCNRSHFTDGCVTVRHHVHQNNIYFELEGYKKTPAASDEDDCNIYALDTESICTKKGLEVCRVTMVDVKKEAVYETYVKPTSDILDYNTWWSGIIEDDLEGVDKTFNQMREELLALINDQTILVGQALNNDLQELKIQHERIVDTSVLYPHRLGHPRKRSLQELARDELGRQIQRGGEGHDSMVDAVVCMDLVLKKVGKL